MKMLRNIVFAILSFMYIGCNDNSQKNEEELLERLAIDYIRKYHAEFLQVESHLQVLDESFQSPLIIEVIQRMDYNGCKLFTIFHVDGYFHNESPTRLIKKGNRHIVMLLKNRMPISKEKIPKSFSRDYSLFTHEFSRIVLMCKNSKRYIAIDDRWATPYEMITQLQEFSCDDEHSKKRPWGRIEDAIIDPNVIVIPPPEPKYLKSVIDSL